MLAHECRCVSTRSNSFSVSICLCLYVLQSQILEALGATVERVRPVSITHREHFVNIARRRALEANELASKHSADCKGGFFADQFENLSNFRAHYEDTGPEIWEQVDGKLDAFIAAAGTGGTVAGVSRFLKVNSLLLRKQCLALLMFWG